MNRAMVNQYTAAARSELGEADFEMLWAAGRAMKIEEAIEYALSEEVVN